MIDDPNMRPPRAFTFYPRKIRTGTFKVTLLIEGGIKDMTHLVDTAQFESEDDLKAHLARMTGDKIGDVRRA